MTNPVPYRCALEFTDGTKDEVASDLYFISETEEPIDATALRDKQIHAVAKEILDIILRFDIKLGEVDYLFQVAGTSLSENFKAANEKKWGGKDRMDIRMSDIDSVLKEGYDELVADTADRAASEGASADTGSAE